MAKATELWRPTWRHQGDHLTEPITIPLTAGRDAPRLEISAALTAAGRPGVYLGMFNLAAEVCAAGIGTPAEVVTVAAALLTQAAAAEERWG